MPSLPSLPGLDGTSAEDTAQPSESMSKSFSIDIDKNFPAMHSNFVTARRSQSQPQPNLSNSITEKRDLLSQRSIASLRPGMPGIGKAGLEVSNGDSTSDEAVFLFGAMTRSGSDRRRSSTTSSLRTSTPQSRSLSNPRQVAGAQEASFLQHRSSASRSPSPILPPPNGTFDIDLSQFDTYKTRDSDGQGTLRSFSRVRSNQSESPTPSILTSK